MNLSVACSTGLLALGRFDPTGRPDDGRPRCGLRPPPCGWSIGFMTTPRLEALPNQAGGRPCRSTCSCGPGSTPRRRGGKHRPWTRRVLARVEAHDAATGRGPTIWTNCRRTRAITPPLPIFISTLWTIVPTGMAESGMALPGFTSTLRARDDRVADRDRRCGARM